MLNIFSYYDGDRMLEEKYLYIATLKPSFKEYPLIIFRYAEPLKCWDSWVEYDV